MSVSKQTSATEAFFAKIVKDEPEVALRSLDYLVCSAANAVYDCAASWDEKRRVLDNMAKFTAARAEQAVGLVDGDPDEDLL